MRRYSAQTDDDYLPKRILPWLFSNAQPILTVAPNLPSLAFHIKSNEHRRFLLLTTPGAYAKLWMNRLALKVYK